MKIRFYENNDYDSIRKLYENSEIYGGQFDENRDSKERLANQIIADPESILVCESENKIMGTVSLIQDNPVAWLFRFAVLANENEDKVTKELFNTAETILKNRGHNQVLVYSPINNSKLDARYINQLNFEKGSNDTCFWKNI